MRRRRHQQEVSRERRKKLTEPVAFGVLDFTAKGRGGHLVRFVADNEIASAIWRLKLLLRGIKARELIESRDHQIGLHEPVAGTRRFDFIVGEDLEREVKSPVKLVLPLFG